MQLIWEAPPMISPVKSANYEWERGELKIVSFAYISRIFGVDWDG